MNENRTPAYAFTSEKDIIAFFRQYLPVKLIRSVIAECRQEFTKRPGTPHREKKLQLLKKCECRLNRMVTKT